MSVSAVAERGQESTAAGLRIGQTAALLFVARSLQYVAFGLTGILLARGLGPEGRGVYGLVNETAAVAASFPGMGLEMAGMYLAGQRRFSWQTVFSNSFTWALVLWAVLAALAGVTLATGEDAFGMGPNALAVAFAGACLIMLTDGAAEFLLPMGRIWPYTFIKLTTPMIRLAGIAAIALSVGLSVSTAVGMWFASFGVAALLTVFFVSQHIRMVPRIHVRALKAQISYGMRGQLGYILQALNHRLDAFLVAYFVGAAATGQYFVGVNLAELGWWIPISLGTVLFPKASAMESRDNFILSAATCRRTLVVTLVAIIGLLVVAQPGIPIVYGTEFEPAVTVFLILLPSGLMYTVHKVLGASLAAHGMPQATLISGLAALPATIGLNLLLIPTLEIKGAAIASNVAYTINALVVLFIFVRVSRLSVRDALLFNREDWRAFKETAAELWNKYVRRREAFDA